MGRQEEAGERTPSPKKVSFRTSEDRGEAGEGTPPKKEWGGKGEAREGTPSKKGSSE